MQTFGCLSSPRAYGALTASQDGRACGVHRAEMSHAEDFELQLGGPGQLWKNFRESCYSRCFLERSLLLKKREYCFLNSAISPHPYLHRLSSDHPTHLLSTYGLLPHLPGLSPSVLVPRQFIFHISLQGNPFILFLLFCFSE